MRQICLLLCLLVFAALCWIVRSNEVLGTTAQNDMVLLKTQILPKAVNTGFKARCIDATSTYAQDVSRTLHRHPGTVIAANPHSAHTILSQSNQLVKLELTELRLDKLPLSNIGSNLIRFL